MRPRRFLPALAIALVAGATHPTATALPLAGFVHRPEEEVILLAVRLRPLLLADTLPAYPSRGGVMVPLGELCALLDLGIHSDAATGVADGFILSEQRRFHLDVSAGQVIVGGKTAAIDEGEVEVHEDDIYVDTRALSRWLPIELDIDLHASTLTIRPREPLPIQQRDDRAVTSQRILAGLGQGQPSYPRVNVPYRLFDVPFVDQTLGLTLEAPTAEGRRALLHYSTYATGDLLAMGMRFYVAGDQDGLSDSRLTLERKDPDGGLLGPLRARELQLGEVLDPGLDLVTLPKGGSGALLDNFPLQRPEQFDRQHFRGELPPGWEVEIHRNESLIGFAQSRSDGLYEFLDVPLLFGLNVFRLVFFGPQGQRREETRIFNVGDALAPPGKVYYRFVASEPGRRLFSASALNQATRWLLETDLGILRRLTASAGVASVALTDGRHDYGRLGLRSYLSRFFLNADVVVDRSGGRAVQAGAQTRLGPAGLRLRHIDLRDFNSERFLPGLASLNNRTELRLDATIPRGLLPRIGVVAEATREARESGRTVRRVSNTLSIYEGGYAISNSLGWASSSNQGSATSSSLSGQLLLSKFVRRFSLRGQADYALVPEAQLTGLGLTVEGRPFGAYLLSGGVSRRFESDEARYTLGLGRSQGAVGFSMNVAYTRPGGLAGNVLLSLSLARDGRTGDWHSTARSLAGSGALSARVFLDRDGDGRLDPEEPLIPEAGFHINRALNPVRTDSAGSAFIAGLRVHRPIGIAVATATLEDPFWKPAREGVSFVPRPGRVAVLDFPIEVYGAIAGTVYVHRAGVAREMGGITLELVDREGSVVASARSASDGYYDLADIRPGGYQLRVAPALAVRLGVRGGEARDIRIGPDGTVLDGVNIMLEPKESPAPAVTSLTAPERVEDPASPPPEQVAATTRTLSPQMPLPPRPRSTDTAAAAGPRFPIMLASDWPRDAPAYVIQLASYQRRETSEREALRLEIALGRPTHVLRADLGERGIWYRVMAGDFATASEAAAGRKELKTRGSIEIGPIYLVQRDAATNPTRRAP